MPRRGNKSNCGFCAGKMDVNNATAVRKMEFTTVHRVKECIQLVDEVTILASCLLELKLDCKQI